MSTRVSLSPATPAGARRGLRPIAGIQGRLAGDCQDEIAHQYSCSICLITYPVPMGKKAKCPLCDERARVRQLQQDLMILTRQIETSENANAKLRTSVDSVSAMKDALTVADERDLTFLKALLYQFRADKSGVVLRPTHGKARPSTAHNGKQVAPANGFLLKVGDCEWEAHACTSVGGIAIAGYFEEALRSAGYATAMTILMRAVGPHLTGGVSA